ncbi:MAG: UxaA family hydrolase [Peptococcaceae bacterium]
MVKQAVVTGVGDNVATATNDLAKGTLVSMVAGEKELEVLVKEEIPFGHKFAIEDIARGEHIIKYSEPIGIAGRNITAGEHVHVKNVDSERGRGDLEPKEERADEI